MERTRNLFSVLIVMIALLSVSSLYVAAQDVNVPSTKELRTLLKTAKEPIEHRRIAAYYQKEAARLRQEAKQHEELAGFYTENPPFPSMVSKHGAAFGKGAPHCKRWAELDNEQAKEAEAFAVLHEDMAKSAEQKQQ